MERQSTPHDGSSPQGGGEGHCPGPPLSPVHPPATQHKAPRPTRAARALGPPQGTLAPAPGRPGRTREMTSGPTGNQSQFQVLTQSPLPQLHFRPTHIALYAARVDDGQVANRPPSNAPAQDLSDEPSFVQILRGNRPGGPNDCPTDSTRSSLTIDPLGVLPLTFLSMGPSGSSLSTPPHLQYVPYNTAHLHPTCKVTTCLTFRTLTLSLASTRTLSSIAAAMPTPDTAGH